MQEPNCQTACGTAEPLRVVISGGGPVGLTLALLLEYLLGRRVAVTVYDGRWMRTSRGVCWRDAAHGNVRRQQVLTLQSRHFTKLPPALLERIFTNGAYSEMWPTGRDSVDGLPPRNVRIADLEDALLACAQDRVHTIRLVPERFDALQMNEALAGQQIFAICEGSRSDRDGSLRALEQKFGIADGSNYSLHGKPVQDVVLGLQVTSSLPDVAAVLLTVSQNRFLLNSMRGRGYLNMRLTEDEAAELGALNAMGARHDTCFQNGAQCTMERVGAQPRFRCTQHASELRMATDATSVLWPRLLQGLQWFGVPPDQLHAVTAFRLSMVQRSRFTAELFPHSVTSRGTYAFLLGDAANAVHFWPGRGLNSGLASAISLARCLAHEWRGRPFRDADFLRHEAIMSMLQYRHKSRAWRFMVSNDEHGECLPIHQRIQRALHAHEASAESSARLAQVMLARMGKIRDRLCSRVQGLPDDTWLSRHLAGLSGETLCAMVASGPWDSFGAGGEEVDTDQLFDWSNSTR